MTDTHFYALEYWGADDPPFLDRHPFVELVNYLNRVNSSLYIENASPGENSVVQPPGAPTGLKVERMSRTSVRFSFNPVSTATSYEIEYRLGSQEWASVPGYNGTSTSYILTDMRTGSYQFRVRARNAGGYSSWAVISHQHSVMPERPIITQEPQDVTVKEGESAQFSVKATSPDGGSIVYEWFESVDGGSNWKFLSEYKGMTSITITAAHTGLDGVLYRCALLSSVDGRSSLPVSTRYAKLTVVGKPKITEGPKDLVLSDGEKGQLSITATADGSGNKLSYQWQVSTNGGPSWSNISGATSSTHTTVAMTRSMHGYLYRCLVRNTKNGVCTEVVSGTARLSYGSVQIAFVNPTEANDNPSNPVTINSGSLIQIRHGGDISEVDVVSLSIDGRWLVDLEPEAVIQTLVPENLTDGRRKLTISLYDYSGKQMVSDSLYFYWSNYREGFGTGRFNLGD